MTLGSRETLLALFGRELPARVARINEALGKLLAERAEARAEPLLALAHDAHNLRGAAATVGLEHIADLAGDLEREAELLLKSGAYAPAPLMAAARGLLVGLDQAFADTSSSSTPTSETAGQFPT